MKIKTLVIGFGRIALSHTPIIKRYSGDTPHIYEKSILSNIAAILLGFRPTPWYSIFLKKYSHVFILTPTFAKETLIKSLKARKFEGRILVEKPLGEDVLKHVVENKSYYDDKLWVGYVYRYDPIIKWLRACSKSDEIEYLNINYSANQFSEGSRQNNIPLLDDMGCHLIDTAFFITRAKTYKILDVNYSEHQGLAYKVTFNILINNNIQCSFAVNKWDTKARKANLSFDGKWKSGKKISSDYAENYKMYGDKVFERDMLYYLRGELFSNQIAKFYQGGDFDLDTAMLTEKCLAEISKC